jgi:hypothetical protein
MNRKASLLKALEQAAQSMVRGSLSESTRRCGDPSCACARDPAYRHGPHLYLKFEAEGKTRSVYVPAQSAAAVRQAQAEWRRFQELAAKISTANRAELLRELEREKKRKPIRGKAGSRSRARSRIRD